MRLFVFPVAALAVIAGGFGDEPSEAEMKRAFSASLSTQIRNALDFIAEVNGPEAVEKIRLARGDQFAVRSFRKLDCTRAEKGADYVCSFAVDLELTNGNLERQMNGRFSPSSAGLTFVGEA